MKPLNAIVSMYSFTAAFKSSLVMLDKSIPPKPDSVPLSGDIVIGLV